MTKRLAASAALVVAIATVTGCGGGGGGKSSVVLYNGQHPELTSALVSAFQRQSGITVNRKDGDSLVIATQILQEGHSSPADVVLTENSPELMTLEQHGLLAQLPKSVLAQVPKVDESPSGNWVGVALRISSLAYDPKLVARSQLPKSILDLAQPRWKGKVAVSPTDSDFPPIVGAVIERFGQARAALWLQGLKRNAQTYQDEEAVTAAVNRGDVALGIINHYYWYRLRLEIGAHAMHSSLYYFPDGDPGSIVNVSGIGVLASSKHRAAALKFIRFVISPDGQRLLAKGDDFEYPALPGVAANPALTPFAKTPHTTVSVAKLGDGSTAARLIRETGLI